MNSETLSLLLLFLLAAASVVLAVVAGSMWLRVWQQKKQRHQQQQQLAQERAINEQNRLAHIHESINVITAAVLDDQCPLTEGCIRLAVLLDNLPLNCSSKHEYSVLFEMYQATRHIPTHEGWNALSRSERRQFEREMKDLENQHEARVRTVLTAIKENPFPRQESH